MYIHTSFFACCRCCCCGLGWVEREGRRGQRRQSEQTALVDRGWDPLHSTLYTTTEYTAIIPQYIHTYINTTLAGWSILLSSFPTFFLSFLLLLSFCTRYFRQKLSIQPSKQHPPQPTDNERIEKASYRIPSLYSIATRPSLDLLGSFFGATDLIVHLGVAQNTESFLRATARFQSASFETEKCTIVRSPILFRRESVSGQCKPDHGPGHNHVFNSSDSHR